MAGKLSKRDKLFTEEYFIDFDCKNAAIRAGFAVSTAKDAYAWIRDENPTKPKVKEEIEKRLALHSRRTGIKADRILEGIANIAFANMLDIIDPETGELRPDIDKADAAAVSFIKIRKTKHGTETEVRIENLAALQLLGKHRGMFSDNVNINATVPVIADDIREDAAHG